MKQYFIIYKPYLVLSQFTSEFNKQTLANYFSVRKNVLTSSIKIILTEGKNRQVRKMTAKVGFPTLRLVRWRIEDVDVKDLRPGEMKELSQKTIYKKLFHE